MSFKPIHVRPGQVWRPFNTDSVYYGKQKLIESIEDGYALCRSVGFGNEYGISSRIRLDRLVPRVGGYHLIHDPAPKSTPPPESLEKVRSHCELIMSELVEAGKNEWDIRYANYGACAWLALMLTSSSFGPYIIATSAADDYHDRVEAGGFCIELSRNGKVLLYAPDPLPPTVWRARLDQSGYAIKTAVEVYKKHGVLDKITQFLDGPGLWYLKDFIEKAALEVSV